MQPPIYLDHQATTPVDPRVLEEMLPCFTEVYGNAASKHHAHGWEAAKLVDRARERVASLIGCDPREILFTSGATESNNLALKGMAESLRDRGNHLISVVTEHKAILDPLRSLAARGFETTLLPVDGEGRIDLDLLESVIRPTTILVSVMAANNEIGTLHPLEEIGGVCSRRGVCLHTDAAQAAGKIPIRVDDMGVGLLSLSGHKMYGPKGVGALYVRRGKGGLRPAPQMEGGGHERGLRSGTLNTPGIVGFGKACEISEESMQEEGARLRDMANRLLARLRENLEGVRLNGPEDDRLPGNLNVSFPGIEAEKLLGRLPRLALSTGSACTTASLEPSHVLRAIGLSDAEAAGSLRIGMGRFTTEAQVEAAADDLVNAVRELRGKT